MGENVLLTGGMGYIGSHLATELLRCGYSVTILDNLSNSKSSVLDKIRELVNGDVEFIRGDVQDSKLVRTVLVRSDIDLVVHLAGRKSVTESLVIPADYYYDNLSATVSLLRVMHEVEVKKIVFSSSANVYGLPNNLPIDEQHSLSPTNPYGRSKLYSEQVMHDLASLEAGWKAVSLRYFNPVGAHPSGLIGENPKGVPGNLMPAIAKVILGESGALEVYGDNYDTLDGTGVRDYIHIMDLVEGHVSAVKYLDNLNGFDIFNLGMGFGHSVMEIIDIMESVVGEKIAYKIKNARKGDVPVCYADASKAKEKMGWSCVRSVEDACRDMANYLGI